jgi:hypothetical protein
MDDNSKLLRLVQKLDEERERRIKAERSAHALRLTLARIREQQQKRTTDAVPKGPPPRP